MKEFGKALKGNVMATEKTNEESSVLLKISAAINDDILTTRVNIAAAMLGLTLDRLKTFRIIGNFADKLSFIGDIREMQIDCSAITDEEISTAVEEELSNELILEEEKSDIAIAKQTAEDAMAAVEAIATQQSSIASATSEITNSIQFMQASIDQLSVDISEKIGSTVDKIATIE